MNLFNEVMKAAKNSAMNYYNQNVGGNIGSNTKQQKLRGLLQVCTYSDQTKFIIEKAVKQVFHVYPSFDTDMLQFKQANQQKRFIQLKAILQIEVRGKICKVDYNMMIPANFPNKAPYVRIVNRSNQFVVDDFYRPLQSPNDAKSYILNQRLNQVKNWDPSKSIVNVIIESYDLMRNRFPFSKPTSTNTNISSQNNVWGNMNNGQWQQPQYNNNSQGWSNNNFNNQGYNNYNNGPFNPNYNNVGMGGNMGMGGNFGNMGFNQNQPMNQPPIPFGTNLNQTISNGQKFAGNSKKTLQKLKVEHTKALQSVQTLDILRYSIQSQQNFLRKQNIQMNNFLSANQNSQTKQSLSNLVKPHDQLSEQILDLVSSIKSRQDCTTQLQKKLNEGDLSLDDFMRHVRKMQETKFQQKVLLAKCISVSQKY